MPEKQTVERARQAKREGKGPSSQAGEFVREEIHHVREGKHGARSTKQAIAIGLSKARRSGVKLEPPGPGQASPRTRKSAASAYRKGQSGAAKPSSRRSRSVRTALEREGTAAASKRSLSRQARQSARRRGPSSRHDAAMKAVRTKGPAGRRQAARKAARTRTRKAAG